MSQRTSSPAEPADAEALGDDDFLAIEPSPGHEVVYQPPTVPPPPDARTIETEKVKIAPDLERAALAKQTTVKIIRPVVQPPPTPSEVRVEKAQRGRALFVLAMVVLAVGGIAAGVYIRHAMLVAQTPAAPSTNSATATLATVPVVGTAVRTADTTPVPPAASAVAEAVGSSGKPKAAGAATTSAAPRATAPLGPPVF